ncbi:MAG: GtrA family protein [Clostridia bacterium]|nr:GtrA family protein [Clostridia bacterium]
MAKLSELWIKYKEVIVYLFFGILTTLVNIVVSYLCVALSVETFLSNVIANVVAMIFAYVTNRIWVFSSKNRGVAMLKEAAEFFGTRVVTMFIDAFFMKALYDWTGWKDLPWAQELFGWKVKWLYLLLKVVSNVIVIVLNYIASKLWIFRKKKTDDKKEG